MAKKGGLTPMWSDREVERWFKYNVDDWANARTYALFQRAGEEFVKIARKKGSYQDRTEIFAALLVMQSLMMAMC